MRKIKGSGNYLKNQVRKNLAKVVLCLMIFALIFVVANLRVLYALSFSIFDAAVLLVSLVPLIVFYFYLHKYRIYRGGWEGEKRVAKLLSSKLNDDYALLNDLYLRSGGGDIDHIVLAPSGIFVLETKNWSGDIVCNGDEWQRNSKHTFRESPSHQVKRNAAQIKRIIDSSQSFGAQNVPVEGILVFSNNRARLHLKNPTVPIIKLHQLSNYIIAYKNSNSYSRQQLELIGKEILKQKN
jgi:Nuclease-related domain